MDYYWLPYLHFNYLPPRENYALPFTVPVKHFELPTHLCNASKVAGAVLSKIVHQSVTAGKKHFIPLSGGLDSRALLAAALEAGADIETLTFGMPGSMDYEYGNDVAKAMGCRHHRFNLLDHLPDTAALVDAVRNGGRWTYTFDAYFNRLLTRQMGCQPIVLHGFAGDPVAGSHYQPRVPDDERAVKAFAMSQQFTRVIALTRPHDNVSSWLPSFDEIPEVKGLTAYERLDFSIRQIGAIRPIVIDPKADARTPFTDPEWLALMFSAPCEWRRGCLLYEAALISRWPELFKLPTKNHIGLGLGATVYRRKFHKLSRRILGRLNRMLDLESWLLHSSHNYIDYAKTFREPGSLQELARENLTDLEVRGIVPWLSPMKLLSDHIDGLKNYERELQVLIGLEINFKADEFGN